MKETLCVLHLKLLGEATVGVGSLLLVVLLVVLGPHLHTSACMCSTQSDSSNNKSILGFTVQILMDLSSNRLGV